MLRTEFNAVRLPHVPLTSKTLQYKAQYYNNNAFHSSSVCNSVMNALMVYQGVQKYANTYFNKKAGHPIVMFGPNNLIDRTFYGPIYAFHRQYSLHKYI